MIIFTPIFDIPEYILEMKNIKNVIKYNLSSLYDNIPTLNLLTAVGRIPDEIIEGDCSTPEFDMSYSNYVINNKEAFNQLMSIIYPVYQDPQTLVQILITQSKFRDALTETLAKLIQQRYGYNTHFIYNVEDMIYIEEPDFSIPGLFRMDQDLIVFAQMNPELLGDIYNE